MASAHRRRRTRGLARPPARAVAAVADACARLEHAWVAAAVLEGALAHNAWGVTKKSGRCQAGILPWVCQLIYTCRGPTRVCGALHVQVSGRTRTAPHWCKGIERLTTLTHAARHHRLVSCKLS